MSYDAYGNWVDEGGSLPIGGTADWTNNPDNSFGDFPPLGTDQPGAGQGTPGFDPYDPGLGQVYADPNGDPFHFKTGVDEPIPSDPSQMPTGPGDAGPWYGPTGPNGQPNPGSGGSGIPDWLKKLGNVVGGNDKSSPRSDILRGAGLQSIGQILAALFAKPTFQMRAGFSGSAAPQKMMENQVGRLNGAESFLTDRAKGGFNFTGNLSPQSPMQGMAGGDDEITKILKGLK